MIQRYRCHGFRRIAAAVIALIGVTPFSSAFGHAFGQRFDLPIPLDYYLAGAGGAVFFSFVLVALFARIPLKGIGFYPRIDLMKLRWVRLISHPVSISVIRLLAFSLFLMILVIGFFGPQDPAKNLLPTMVWIIWWIGVAYFCALIGNLWSLINPWNSLYLFLEYLIRKIRGSGKGTSLNLHYPSWLGVWPASFFFLVFVWGELVWTANAIPLNLATAIAIYSLVTWLGMFLFGRETWLQKGESFSLFFGLLARFSLLEMRRVQPSGEPLLKTDHELNLRPIGVGLMRDGQIPNSLMLFVILMLSTVTFDGFMGTPLWANIIESLPDWRPLQPVLFQLEMWGIYRETVLTTTGLILSPLLFTGLYLGFAWMMRLISPFSVAENSGQERALGTVEVAAYFVFSLLPIALAYHLAHYFSYLLIVGQFMIPLASDPFGLQWDLFGTLGYRVDIAIVGARFVWNASLVSIVVGHMIAVYVAHVLALRIFKDRKQALISQIPMLILMIGYTMLSLWILAQPLIE